MARNDSEGLRSGEPLSDAEILAIFDEYKTHSAVSGMLAERQAEALARYQGEPYGNERPGRSRVMMRDVFEIIEWSKPSLMRIFLAGEEVVRFVPHGPEDVDAAQQITDYVNLIALQRNNAFEIIYAWIVDGFLCMTGYVGVEWRADQRVTMERYEQLSIEQITQLIEDSGGDRYCRVTGKEELPPEPGDIDPATGQPVPRFNIELTRLVKPEGAIRMFSIPPERMMVNADHPSIDLADAKFVGYYEDMTLSDLRAMGFDVDDDVGGPDSNSGTSSADAVGLARNPIDPIAARAAQIGDLKGDPSSREVRVYRVWMMIDADGDGVAERRHMIIVGNDILFNEIDDLVSVAAFSPILMPHRHQGVDFAQVFMELQEIKTALVRGLLDNVYLSADGRFAVDEDRVVIEDLQISRPGGIVRVTGDPGTAIAPLKHPSLGVDVLRAIEYLDGNKEERTGISRLNQGLDANTLNKTAQGQAQLKAAALERLELIARVLAETGMKQLFLIIHAMTRKYQRRRDVVMLRGTWVEINPAEWRERRDAVPNVGLGLGDQKNKLGFLQMQITAQQGVLPLGLATPANIYESLIEFSKAGGYKDATRFWTKVQPGQQMPEKQDPMVMAKMADIQFQREKLQAELADAKDERAHEIQKELLKLDGRQQEVFTTAQAQLASTALTVDSRRGEVKSATAKQMGVQTDDQAEVDQQIARDQGVENLVSIVSQLAQQVNELRKPRAVRHEYDAAGRIVRSVAD